MATSRVDYAYSDKLILDEGTYKLDNSRFYLNKSIQVEGIGKCKVVQKRERRLHLWLRN